MFFETKKAGYSDDTKSANRIALDYEIGRNLWDRIAPDYEIGRNL